MSLKTTWMIPQRVMYSQYVGVITRQDMLGFVDDFYALQPEGQDPVHWVHDRRYLTKPYANLPDMVKLIKPLRGISGWVLFFGDANKNPVLNLITSVVAQGMSIKTRPSYDTLEQLWQFLLEQDSSLPSQAPTLPELHSDSELQTLVNR